VPDVRGHGTAPRIVPGDTSDLAEDLSQLIAHVGIPRPIIMGHSMGAMLTLHLAVRQPTLARALVLEDPPWSMTEPPFDPARHPQAPWVETITRLSLTELIAQTRSDHPRWPEDVVQTWCAAKQQLDPRILDVLRIRRTEWVDLVPRITCPTLVITADPGLGGIVTPEISVRVQALNPRCAIAHVPGAGHHVRFHDHATYLEAVRRFLATLPA
jgi:pimeloyl-ACP methyl ester carboxylesterase